MTYDGGVAVLDGATLEVLSDQEAEGFVRVNAAGDGRHFFLTEGESFRLIDGGTWAEPHGDHDHFYTTDPQLSDVTVDGPEPGHVVSHDGIGTLFFDGSGDIHSYDLAELDIESELETDVTSTEEAHHGVAAVFADGGRFETLGDEDERSGARVLDAEGEEIARSEDCPGVHGEAAGPEGIIAVGCEDGVLLWDGAEFSKIDSGEDYARTGNLFPAEDSTVFLGDYNLDADGEEPMTQVALVDAASEEVSVVDVGAAYNFRSLARGPEGEALVLAEDGQLHVIDPETGEQTDQLEVMDEWTEPEEWQEPRPAIRVLDDIAYITEPDAQTLHMVDLTSMEIINTAELDFTPNEIAAVDGRAAEGAEDHEGEHAEGEHEDEHEDEHAENEAAEEDDHEGHDHD
ncbi:zinc metallochaperone AztD [Nesterenkonia lutea]